MEVPFASPNPEVAVVEVPKEEDRVIPPRWWENFWFREGASVEAYADNDWWAANVRRYENFQVHLRYQGAGDEDDEWVDIDDVARLRPPVDGSSGNQHCQVGQQLKVLFDEERWYTGAIIQYDRVKDLFQVQFDDGEHQQIKFPDPDARIATPIPDLVDALLRCKKALEGALEEYAAAKEIPQTVHSNIRSAAKACFSAADKRVKSNKLEIDTEHQACSEFLDQVRQKLLGYNLMEARDWLRIRNKAFPKVPNPLLREADKRLLRRPPPGAKVADENEDALTAAGDKRARVSGGEGGEGQAGKLVKTEGGRASDLLQEVEATPGGDEALDWMGLREILGVRLEGRNGMAHRLEYLVHLRDDQEDLAEAPYPTDGTYTAKDGERVSAIAKRFGVNLEKLLELNSNFMGLQANSRLLSHTCLQLPTRAHLRWVEASSPSGKVEFPKQLPEFLTNAFAEYSVIHPLMHNAEDIFQAWLKDEVRPGRGGLTSTSVTGGARTSGAPEVSDAERVVTGVRMRNGETHIRVSWDGLSAGLPSLEMWQPLRPGWGKQVAAFLLVSVGAVCRDLGKTRWERLLRLCGLVSDEPEASTEAMDEDDDWGGVR